MDTELQFLLYDDPAENNNINVVIKDDTSRKATRFRQWATRTLNEFIRKGFVMDDERQLIQSA